MRPRSQLFRIAISLFCISLIAACGPPEDDEEVAEAPGELLEGDQPRDTDPDVDDETFEQFTADNRDFSFSMFDELRADEDDGENVFVSPHSISSALAMTYEGADGNTRDEMAEALQFGVGDEDLHPSFNELDLELESRTDIETDEDEELELEIVNQTWGQQDYPFLDDYLDALSLHYGAGMQAVDFGTNPDQIRQDINEWVEDQTNDLIEDLLPPGSIDALTRLVLVNAIYFYGTWDDPFDEDRTSTEPFITLDGSTVDAEMMRHDEPTHAGYYEDDDTVAVSMPYIGGDLAMVALMPAEPEGDETPDFSSWEEQFDRQTFDEAVDGLETLQGWIDFPKFEDEGEYNLIPPFEELGMVDAFSETEADFGRMADIEESGENLFITGIFHKTFVEVDEVGTEAAAATGVVVGTESAPMVDFEVSFDRPFYYAIYDHGTDTILFMGRMLDPS